jgi:hypothetical protein
LAFVVVVMTKQAEAIDVLATFRERFSQCLRARADALFELTEALLCTDGPVKALVGLSLAPEHRRGHGALYDALKHGRNQVEWRRRQLAGAPLPRTADGRLLLAVDVSPWLRPDGNRSPQRSFCHTYGRGKDEHRMIPGRAVLVHHPRWGDGVKGRPAGDSRSAEGWGLGQTAYPGSQRIGAC